MQLNKTTLIYILAPVAVILLIALIFFGLRDRPFSTIRLEFWGFESEEAFRSAIKSFRASYPYVEITYVQKSPQTYEKELLSAMAGGHGPDVYPINHTWVARYQDKISPLPDDLMPLKTFYDTFVDVASQDLIFEGSIWAIPFYIDSLALYWNKDIFNNAGLAQPPKTWNDFIGDVEKLTVKDDGGNLTKFGAALGTALNVNSATDITLLLMLQSGTEMVDKNREKVLFNKPVILNTEARKPGEEALRFYTDFSNPQKKVFTWNARAGNSLESFIQGRVAMMLDYSSVTGEIFNKSPYLNFAIAPAPQIKEAQIAVNYADYWAQTVWSGSKNANYAWNFVLHLAEKENIQQYLTIAKKPASRRDLIAWQQNDPYLGVFATQALSARSWYQIDNQAIKEIFGQMIESVVLGQASAEDALERAANQINVLMEEKRDIESTSSGMPLE